MRFKPRRIAKVRLSDRSLGRPSTIWRIWWLDIDLDTSRVFGAPLKESLRYASVQISTANKDGAMYVWGYIPVVVAKWCVYPSIVQLITLSNDISYRLQWTLSQRERWLIHSIPYDAALTLIHYAATETQGIFRISGSAKRMKDLQMIFEAPPRVSLSSCFRFFCIYLND